MRIQARAPLRISFAGGGTDITPYFEEHGGVVLSTTINKYAHALLISTPSSHIEIKDLDQGTVVKYSINEQLAYDGNADFAKAIINYFQMKHSLTGFRLYISTDVPRMSGLGASSASVVALISLFQRWLSLPMKSPEIAELAYQIERVHLGMLGGKQDHYAATFGGLNLIEFFKERVVVNRLRIEKAVISQLENCTLLCYTGIRRVSEKIIENQLNNYLSQKYQTVTAMAELKQLALEMKQALLNESLETFGELLHQAWISKKKMTEQITNDSIDQMYETARKHGALGGKLLGAGGGGYLFFLCPIHKTTHVAQKLEQVGGRIVRFAFDFKGVQSWCQSPNLMSHPFHSIGVAP